MKYQHPTVDQLLARTIKSGDCMEWSGKRTRSGYGRLNINTKETYAHRAMMVAKTGMPIPEKMCVLHSCDNKPCINPNHLRIGTHKDNSQDAKERGRLFSPNPELWSGTNNPKSVLTEKQKEEIIELMKSGMSALAVSEIYPVSSVRCSQIRKEAGIQYKRTKRWFRRPE